MRRIAALGLESPAIPSLVTCLTHLNLSGSYFQGEIPSQISYLSKLASLDLSFNPQLKWKEDTWKRLLQNATDLRELVLDYTDMSSVSINIFNLSSSLVTLGLRGTWPRGNLTNDIFCLPKFQHLYLSDNEYLQSQLPQVNCRNSSLSILDLSNSRFQGSIPPSLSNLTHLTYLDLSFNSLNGSIPSSLLTLPRLTFLNLNGNHLSGQIPNVFPQSNRFEKLHLSGNYLGGELPSTISNLQHLIMLDLSENEFSGQIPSSLFGLTQLSYVRCSHNKLQGPLPNRIAGFSNLITLLLDDNLLNGTIPSWCLSLPSLKDLRLSGNKFIGLISANISNSLENLDLSYNKLQGNIPATFFSLANLTELDLSSNNLSGSVHFPFFSKLQNLQYLYLSQNELTLNFESNVNNYSFSYLKSLDLSFMGLTEFPKLSGKVPNLSFLDLSNNKIHGRVPNWLHEMRSLYLLDLSHNRLTQSLNQFSRNHQLKVLYLSFNSLSGDISSSICNASSIRILQVSHNKLTGIIPQCLANSSSLEVLDLQLNKLHGTLPTFSNNCGLRTLDLYGNQLEGSLPESLSNCTHMEDLDLGNNQLEDTFPHWLQSLPNLTVLVLRANKLYGPIASLKTKHGFPSLVVFDISSNNFSGPIPKSLIQNFEAMKDVVQDDGWQYISTSLTGRKIYTDSVTVTTKAITITMEKIRKDFVSIDLSKNRFEGEIPNVIGELHSLRGFNLSHNRFSGRIPQSLGNLTNLESLDLSSNMLTGNIPTELNNLNFLEVLNLSNNHLVGAIPQGEQFNTFSNDSYKGNSGLCGLPLTRKCSKDPEQHSLPSLTIKREQGFEFGWKPVAIGYGCGMVFGVGMGCCVLLKGKPLWLVRMVA
ncbi:unnamed protein product [Sphenostylis stenocarpa]|uniref:Chaoptin n=1 Tax=Sphenostylis stenocarpa TaxID=92480 RepID=A0AA86VYL9_9FABA|nr:unnamed protein product [Sphenostylis stenocarpa]